MFDLVNVLPQMTNFNELYQHVRSGKNTTAFGVCQNMKPYIATGIDRFVVYVASDYVSAQRSKEELSSIGKTFSFFPSFDEVLLSKKRSGSAIVAQRSKILHDILRQNIDGVVVTPDALVQILFRRKSFEANIIKIHTNDTFDMYELINRLVKIGYQQDEELAHTNSFVRHGDILDIVLGGEQEQVAVRVEFFGDTVEEIRLVDRQTKKSIRKKREVTILPLCDFFEEDFEEDLLKEEVFQSLSRIKNSDTKSRANTICEQVFLQLDNKSTNHWLLPMASHGTFFDFLPESAVIVFEEPKIVEERLKGTYEEHYNRMAFLLEKGEVLPHSASQLIEQNSLTAKSRQFCQVGFLGLTAKSNLYTTERIVNFKSTPLVTYKNKVGLLASDIKSWETTGYKVTIFAGEKAQILQEELEFFDRLAGVGGGISTGGTLVSTMECEKGFVDHTDKVVFVGIGDIFTKTATRKVSKAQEKVFTTPEIGDFVVHEVHGVGLCQGIETVSGSFGTKDFIVVEYKNADKLYVPVDGAHLVSKYSGSDKKPSLSKLGGNDFEKVKAKVKAKIKEMAIDLIALYKSREKSREFVYEEDSFLTDEFKRSFGFNETQDQIKAIDTINKEMSSKKIIDRLICGDVGFGKTEVALRAAFRALACGKQVAFLSPTTVLCEQHFATAKKRFESFGIKVGVMSRFRSKAQQQQTLEQMKSGEMNFVCGTHRLLSKDVQFKDLSMLILDEEQRFGVEAKEKIKSLKNSVDVLTLSATPIPRTLHMSLTGMRDISIIQTPPKERQPVETFVLESNDNMICDIIMREVNRQGQVFLIYNKVESIDRFCSKLSAILPNVKFKVAHGQMAEKTLEDNIYAFTKGEADVLVSSTIVENGIDIPNANTIIVYDCDMFGLSQLYQLRGRVGRSDRRAFAYFMYKEGKVLTEVAYKRLTSIMEHTELGSGFKIAMKDLEIRGAGNVLGREQHGHMEKVGYDLYCKLLSESMAEIEGKASISQISTTMDIDMDMSAGNYIDDGESRMAFYQRLATIDSHEKARDLHKEICDIYGKPPKSVENLLKMALLKGLSAKVGITEVVVKSKETYLAFANKEKFLAQGIVEGVDRFKHCAKFDFSTKLLVRFDSRLHTVAQLFDVVCEFVNIAAK